MKLKLFLSVFILIGCASNGAERKPMRPKNFISQEEIKEIAIPRTEKMLSKYLDQLDGISIKPVKEMRFLPSPKAVTMYGTNNLGGVIEFKSR